MVGARTVLAAAGLLMAGCSIDFYADLPCDEDDQCPTDYGCAPDGSCMPLGDYCPVDVVVDFGTFEMDAYEASRPDATATSTGTARPGECSLRGGSVECDTSIACSAPGVLPWSGANLVDAVVACAEAGKHPCTVEELEAVCRAAGPYPYGAPYVAGNCNDRDAGLGELAPTGSHPQCVDETGEVFDLVGNLGELPGYVGDSSTGLWSASDSLQGGTYTTPSPTCDMSFSGAGQEHAGFRCCR